MKKIFKYLLVFAVVITANGQVSANFEVVEPVQYNKFLQQDSIQLVDVRTPKEFKEGHIKGAENIDFLDSSFISNIENLDRTKPLYIYCRSGNRSAKAAAKLSEMGFKEIIDLKGGYNAWRKFEKE